MSDPSDWDISSDSENVHVTNVLERPRFEVLYTEGASPNPEHWCETDSLERAKLEIDGLNYRRTTKAVINGFIEDRKEHKLIAYP